MLKRKMENFYRTVDAIAFTARDEGIAQESSAAEAKRGVISTAVFSWFTISANSAMIRVTQIT